MGSTVMSTIQGTVRSRSKRTESRTPDLEITIDAHIAAKQMFVQPERTEVVLRIDSVDYIGAVLAHKPEHKSVWISPTIRKLSGERLKLRDVLEKAGFAANSRVQLTTQSQIVIEVSRQAE